MSVEIKKAIVEPRIPEPNPSGVNTSKPVGADVSDVALGSPTGFTNQPVVKAPDAGFARPPAAARLHAAPQEKRGLGGLFRDMEEKFGKIDWKQVAKNYKK